MSQWARLRNREQKVMCGISEGSKAMKDGLKRLAKEWFASVGVLKGIRIDLVEVGLKR